jgi:hypothetical protein
MNKNVINFQSTQSALSRGLINQGEYCTIQLLESAIKNYDDYIDTSNGDLLVYPEFSLGRLLSIHLGDLSKITDSFLRDFAFSCSTLDAVIVLRTDNYYPLVAIERQGKYHAEERQQVNDRKKLDLLNMIEFPLLWQDEPQIGKVRFFEPPDQLLCTVHPYANRGFEEFREMLWSKLEVRLKSLPFTQVA